VPVQLIHSDFDSGQSFLATINEVMAQNAYQCQSEGLSDFDKPKVYIKYDTQDKNTVMIVHD